MTVAVTGNAVGKDFLVGSTVPWWLATRKDSLVVVTGPSQTVLGSVTWKEVRRAVNGSKIPLGMRISQGIKGSPLTLTMGDGWHALGFSTTSVERASGQHAAELLCVVEEASGVDDETWDAIDGLGYTRLLVIGNPLRASGRFVELIKQAEQDRRDGTPANLRVNVVKIPSTASPHAGLDRSPWGLADRTWLEACYRKYGKRSLWVRTHIDAEIPEESSEQLIPSWWLDRGIGADRPPINPFDTRGRRISCDLGEGVGRDATAIVARDACGVLELTVGADRGLADAAAEIARLARRWGVEHQHISYDKLGVGRDLRHHLARHGILTAVGYFGCGKPRDPGFLNLRSEAAWRFRQRLDPERCVGNTTLPQTPFVIPAGAHTPQLREEIDELEYELIGRKTALISKELLCARLGRSPDLSDALIQSFAFG